MGRNGPTQPSNGVGHNYLCSYGLIPFAGSHRREKGSKDGDHRGCFAFRQAHILLLLSIPAWVSLPLLVSSPARGGPAEEANSPPPSSRRRFGTPADPVGGVGSLWFGTGGFSDAAFRGDGYHQHAPTAAHRLLGLPGSPFLSYFT